MSCVLTFYLYFNFVPYTVSYIGKYGIEHSENRDNYGWCASLKIQQWKHLCSHRQSSIIICWHNVYLSDIDWLLLIQVFIIKIGDCSQYSDCNSCIKSTPLCGWCTLEGMCLRKTNCLKAHLRNRWLRSSSLCISHLTLLQLHSAITPLIVSLWDGIQSYTQTGMYIPSSTCTFTE